MQEEGRLEKMMELSNKLILWASNDTLVTWIKLVEEGQRGKLTTPRFAQQWTQLDANMRKDLGYGSGLAPEQLYPILFSPETVDRIKTASLDN